MDDLIENDAVILIYKHRKLKEETAVMWQALTNPEKYAKSVQAS
jgi:hypothetical protein